MSSPIPPWLIPILLGLVEKYGPEAVKYAEKYGPEAVEWVREKLAKGDAGVEEEVEEVEEPRGEGVPLALCLMSALLVTLVLLLLKGRRRFLALLPSTF